MRYGIVAVFVTVCFLSLYSLYSLSSQIQSIESQPVSPSTITTPISVDDPNWWSNSLRKALIAVPPISSATPPGNKILIGIFSTLSSSSAARRSLFRNLFSKEWKELESEILIKFVVGRAISTEWNVIGRAENEREGDMIFLEEMEAMNEGKSIEWFEFASKFVREEKEGAGIGWVVKSDDDSFFIFPNLLREIKQLDSAKNVYFGTAFGSWGSYKSQIGFGIDYFRGMAYGSSLPIVNWIESAHIPAGESRGGTEDARIGLVLHFLEHEESPFENPGVVEEKFEFARSPIVRVEMLARMTDWDAFEIDENVIVLHKLKEDILFPRMRTQVLEAWNKIGRPYRWNWDNDTIDSTSSPIPKSTLSSSLLIPSSTSLPPSAEMEIHEGIEGDH